MTALSQHPLSAAFPSMTAAEIEALAMDIEKHGQREKGVMYEGMVLDGWHRYLACQTSGVKFKSEEYDGDDPVAFVISRNAHRRHLTASQRAHAVAACHEWRTRGGDQSAPGALRSKTDAELAKAAGVSERTVEQAKAAIRAGIGDSVKDGEVSAKRASEVAKLPPAKREKALAEKPIKPKVIAADPKFEKLYEKVKTELVETKEALAEMTDLAASAEAFRKKEEFKEMQNLRAELRAVKQRRGELMRENNELRKDLAYWKKQAKK